MISKIMISAPKSGSGKTTVTCALLELLKKKGKNPVAFKCGPDFIDPMFHEKVLGVHSTNLDSFFCDKTILTQIFEKNCRENAKSESDDEIFAVLEGVMGLFDGLAGKSIKASTYDVAKILKIPILLVIDADGMSRSVVPLIKGFLDYDKNQNGENLIKGVFLNKVSKSTFLLLKNIIEDEANVPVVGYFSKDSKDVLKSRHLGLVLPSEIRNLHKKIKETAEELEKTLDFDALERISREKTKEDSKITAQKSKNAEKTGRSSEFSIIVPKRTVAVAYDEAFCFYYRENLRLLEEFGAKIEYFSPLNDKSLPKSANALLIGGGYPELYAARLQENEKMRLSIKSALEKGIPVIAECGGFMYLQEKLVGGGFSKAGGVLPISQKTEMKVSYEMCGAIKGECVYTGKLVRFGYAQFTKKNQWHGEDEKSIKGHEFHYFDSTNNGLDFVAKKPLSEKSWDCIIYTPTMLAGFPHLYYPSNPKIVEWFLKKTAKN